MEEPVPKPDKTPEKVPWGEVARGTVGGRDPGAIGQPDREQMGEPERPDGSMFA